MGGQPRRLQGRQGLPAVPNRSAHRRAVERIRARGYVRRLALGAGGVWLLDWHNPRLQRIDPASHERTATVEPRAEAGTVAAGGDKTLWGSARRDSESRSTATHWPSSARPVSRARRGRPFDNTLAADAEGAWVANPEADVVLRIEAGEVVSRIPVGPDPGPVAVGDDAVWVAYGDRTALPDNYRLARIDPETDTVAATVDLGRHQPKAILPVGDDVWVIAGDGTALLVTTSDD